MNKSYSSFFYIKMLLKVYYKITSKNEYKKQKPRRFVVIDEITPKPKKKFKIIDI